MCGIVGIIGPVSSNSFTEAYDGLKSLEYRGYDSFGFGAVISGQIQTVKRLGAVSESNPNTLSEQFNSRTIIGHTRWATHGRVTENNSHPHVSCDGIVAIVHNGVIANYTQLLDNHPEWKLSSETDTEIAANLIAEELKHCNGDLPTALGKAMSQIDGEFAICGLLRDQPNTLFAIKRKSPLAVGRAADHTVFSSDRTAFGEISSTFELMHLEDGDIVVARDGDIQRYKMNGDEIQSLVVLLKPDNYEKSQDSLSGYPHYMIKEIHETPVAVRRVAKEMMEADKMISAVANSDNIFITGSGSAFYVGMVAQNMFRALTGKYLGAHPSDEFLNIKKTTDRDLIIAVSQSGETFDTLEVLRKAQSDGAKVVAINNVLSSSMQRMADHKVYQNSGKEVCVLSTKSVISQLTALYLLSLGVGEKDGTLTREALEKFRQDVAILPVTLEKTANDISKQVEEIAKTYCGIQNWFFIGRGIHYPVAMESALKFKEVSYLHAEGMPAGFLKHGTISLIDDRVYTMAFLPSRKTNAELFQATLDNVHEIRARAGNIIGIGHDHLEGSTLQMFTEYIELPDINNELNALTQLVAGQLIAYHCGVALNRNIDRPRALAKSVTVR